MHKNLITTCHAARAILNTLSLMDLKQYNYLRNYKHRILDLAITNMECTLCPACPLLKEDRHHPSIILTVVSNPEKLLPVRPITKYNYRNGDYNYLNNSIATTDWNTEFRELSAESALNRFYKMIMSIIDQAVPRKLVKNSKHPAWFNSELIRLSRQRERAWIKWKTYGNV